MPYKDKEQQKLAQAENYKRHKLTVRERNKARRIERRAWFVETVLTGAKCAKCPERDPACLDFHHRDPRAKEGEVMKMLHSFRSKESILKEIEKCDVLCSNCHRKLHYYTDL